MNTLRVLVFLAAAACVQTASAYEVTATQTHTIDYRLNRDRDVVFAFPHPFSAGFPMEMSFVGFAENLMPAPYTNNFILNTFSGTWGSLARHVFPLAPLDADGHPVPVPISFTYSSPTTVDIFYTRYSVDGPSVGMHFWGTHTQTGTVVDPPIIKLPNLIVEAGATQVQGIATVTGVTQNIAGLEFMLQVANGGPDNNPPSAPIVPISISNMNTDFPGSVFSTTDAFHVPPNSSGGTGYSEIFPGEFQIALMQSLVNPGAPFASINGTDLPLVNFTLALHDPLPGTYPLVASRTNFGNTYLLDDSRDDAVVEYVHTIDGSITILPRADTIVPEPGTIVLAAMAALCIASVSRAQRRRRAPR